MRKQYKNKKASCAMCKPHKRGWDNRWKANVKATIKAKEIELEES